MNILIICYSMGKTKLTCDVRKNWERKKYLKLNVRIPLKLTKLFQVSLPLCNYTHAPATNGDTLRARLRTCQLPTNWSLVNITVSSESNTPSPSPCFSLYTVQCTKPPFVPEVTYSITVHTDLTWALNLGPLPILPSQVPRLATPTRLVSVPEVLSLLDILDSVHLCVGNPEDQYLRLEEEKGPLMDKTGTVCVYHTIYNVMYLHNTYS